MSAAGLALVTGSCRRLGAHIAAALAAAGYDVALHATRDPAPEAWLVEAIEAAGATWHGFACDLDDFAAVEALVPAVAARFGRRVDVLVNNASMFDAGDGALPDAAALVAHYRVNVAAPIALSTAVAGQGGCAIVNILDQRIARPHRDQLAYTLSKQALAEATRTLAAVLAPVRVNAVAPGLTLPTADYAPAQIDALAAMMPLGQLPTPQAIADAVCFLVGAGASTGQTLYVDGGAAQACFARDFVHLGRD
ncbi:SDR family oxidoreductase [Sphingomonas sp. S1-29]|uniref:SDR family oxidoreductase n=1 Tax=Sphingomonas sp. S1-29 TaxID=2991074 RepID=UPI00223F14F0|nr:SDR family oxidoreductase [Sphingomonas sp. S1-29]UZK69232.1 SDR family oxidoreductase [Sphingomonas sp. S1-29]